MGATTMPLAPTPAPTSAPTPAPTPAPNPAPTLAPTPSPPTPAPTPSSSNPLPRCVSLQSSHGKYVYADFGGEVRAVSDKIGDWEKFTVVQLSAVIALRSIH